MRWDFVGGSRVLIRNLFWNPDLLILGTETYNHHPETGMEIIEPQPSGREFSHAIIGINIFKGKARYSMIYI